jgi:hypothetical protein
MDHMTELGLLSPEDWELAQKRAQLLDLETQLSERELALATLQAELSAFEALYLRVVGTKFAERDDLQAQIAEIISIADPESDRLHNIATEAREKANESAAANAAVAVQQKKESFKPTDRLRSLYREIAKRVHPDLATDQRDRSRRTQIMAEANLAYAAGDEARLRAILQEWEASPDSVEGVGVAAELIRTIRKIHQITQRLARIDDDMATLKTSELHHLRDQVEAAQARGRDLLAEMREQLEAEIEQLKAHLAQLTTRRSQS